MGLNFHIYKSRLDETFLFLTVIVNNLQLSWRVREMGSENVKIMSLFKSQMSRKYYLKEDSLDQCFSALRSQVTRYFLGSVDVIYQRTVNSDNPVVFCDCI